MKRKLASRVILALRLANVRLRFFVVLALIFFVLAAWDRLERWRDWVFDRWGWSSIHMASVSPDTEYFCPMCPGVLSSWPDKCSVCRMPLVRRRRGETALLPDGVLARMQLSPYRLHLAGVATVPVRYEALQRQWTSLGKVEAVIADLERVEVRCQIGPSDVPFVREGQTVEVGSLSVGGSFRSQGTVIAVQQITNSPSHGASSRISIVAGESALVPGSQVQVRWSIPLADIEPFRSVPRDPPAIASDEPREVHVCDDHPQFIHLGAGTCPFHDAPLQSKPLNENQRLQWFCPAHEEVVARQSGRCNQCSDLPLVPRVVTYSPPAQVLSVPDSAVIDTGTSQWVYVDKGHGMFDAVAIQVGQKCSGAYPVLAGLEAGQRVVATGAFLLDAETRLNPSLAAGYFGAGSTSGGGGVARTASVASNRDSQLLEKLEKLEKLAIPHEDLARMRRQRICPVTGLELGSMGVPPRIVVDGQLVYLCCAGCIPRVRIPSPATPLPSQPPAVDALEATGTAAELDRQIRQGTPAP